MRPVLEDNVGGDGPQVLEEAISRTTGDDGGAPGDDAEIGGGVECEGEQVEGDQNAGESFLAVPKVVFEIVSVVFSTLKVSFSIFQRARPQAASSATVPAVIARSVTKLLW